MGRKSASEFDEADAIVRALTGQHPPHVMDGGGGVSSAAPVPARAAAPARAMAPPADVDPAEIPRSLAELTTAITRSYDLSATRAGDLSIPVVGSVSGGHNRRVVVLERTAYKGVTGKSGAEYQFGYALRLCLTVNKWDANLKVSLPFLAASAQMGQVEASWMLQVLGLSGSKIDAAIVPPAELNVETFVIAKQSLTALIEAVNDTGTTFSALQLARLEPAARRDAEFMQSVAKAYALSRIARRSSLADALNRIRSGDSAINDTIRDTYDVISAGASADRPSEDAARKSRDLLGGIEADV